MTKHLLVILASLLLVSCTKNDAIIVINPEPCFYADRTNINKNDTIVFTNCSKADIVYFMVVKRNDTPNIMTVFQVFDKSNVIYQVFKDSGLFDAVINPQNFSAGTRTNIQQRIPISVK